MSPHKLKFFIYETTQLTDFFFSLPSAVFFGAGAGLLGLFFASSWKGQVTLDVRRLTDWTQVQTHPRYLTFYRLDASTNTQPSI